MNIPYLPNGQRCFQIFLAAVTVCISGFAQAAEHPSLPTVESVDLSRYVGNWYEIAMLPNRFERQCVSDTQATYRLEEGVVRVLNRCRTTDGSVSSARGLAKVVAGSGNAKLRVSFFRPFYGDYWILALDPDYSEVLAGTPDRRYGWILARRPDMPPTRLQTLLERAHALGFDSSAFKRIPHVLDLGPVDN